MITEDQLDQCRHLITIHTFGFLDPAGERLREPGEISVSLHVGSVEDVALGVMGKAIEQGYQPKRLRTWHCDGIVQSEWRVPNRPEHADLPMWHLFTRLSDRWGVIGSAPKEEL